MKRAKLLIIGLVALSVVGCSKTEVEVIDEADGYKTHITYENGVAIKQELVSPEGDIVAKIDNITGEIEINDPNLNMIDGDVEGYVREDELATSNAEWIKGTWEAELEEYTYEFDGIATIRSLSANGVLTEGYYEIYPKDSEADFEDLSSGAKIFMETDVARASYEIVEDVTTGLESMTWVLEDGTKYKLNKVSDGLDIIDEDKIKNSQIDIIWDENTQDMIDDVTDKQK